MTKDKVIFLIDEEWGKEHLFCIFLDTKRRINDTVLGIVSLYDCYAHIGQHTTAYSNYLSDDKIREADPNEYSELLDEIIQMGYKPEVIQIKDKLC